MPDSSRLRIPPAQRSAFMALADMSDEDFATVLRVINEPGVLGGVEDLERRISTALPDAQTDSILPMLFSLDRFRESEHATAEAIADRAVSGIGQTIKDDARPTVRRRLVDVLQSSGLQRASKATDLLYSNERNIDTIRIVTELRPLFEDDPSVLPTQALVVHRLEVNFFGQTGATETRHFALDSIDLRRLSEAVSRARIKERTILTLACNSDITILNPPDDAS